MKITYLYALFCGVLLITLLQSCKKKNNNPAPTTQELIKAWKVQSVVEDANNTDVTQAYLSYKVSFASDNTYQLTLVDNTTESGNWVLSSDQKTLTLTSVSTVRKFEEVSLSATQLVYQETETNTKSGNIVRTYTFVPA